MRYYFLLLCCLFSLLVSQEPGFSTYSGRLLFKPLVANTFEPRVGLIWHSNNNRLRLDVGNSISLIQYIPGNFDGTFTFGADFFTYTQLRGETNFHFPVDAVDYLFGIHANYIDTLAAGVIATRLRLSHISAHFVDGHYDNTTRLWKDGMAPRVYSREFFDLVLAYEPSKLIRIYAGSIFIWHVDPTTLPKYLTYVGGEPHIEFLPSVIGYSAYQFTMTGMRPRHEVQLGLKLGTWNNRGTQIFFMYFVGSNIHGEYYDRKDEYAGIGFNVDF